MPFQKHFHQINDGKNDVLSVKVIGFIDLKNFKIYNRYGEIVFATQKLNEGCNGKHNGILQPTGAFIWIAEGKDIKGLVVKDKGSIILIR